MTEDENPTSDEPSNEALPTDIEAAVSVDDQPTLTIAQSTNGDYQDVFDGEIDRLVEELGVPAHAGDMASRIARELADEMDLTGRAIELWAAACLYCACKVTEIPLCPADFTDARRTILTRKMLLHRSTEVASTVGLDPAAFFGSTHYAEHYCEELGLSDEVQDRAMEIVERLDEDGLSSGKSPTGWAAAAVYNAAREHGEAITQTTVSGVANVTEVTIRNRYQEQRAALREMEPTAATPEERVDHIISKIHPEGRIRNDAIGLLELARGAGVDVEEESDAWAAAAVFVSSEQHDDRIGLRTLQQYYDRDSVDIRALAAELRQIRRDHTSQHLQRQRGDEGSAD